MAVKIQGMKLKSVDLNDDSSDDERDTAAAADDLVGLSLEKLNLGPKKKLLVLSLGGLLVHRVHIRKRASVEGFHPHLYCGNFLVFKRPFCDEFLKFCFQRFDVGLWSSAREHNVDDVLHSIGSGIKSKFVFVWDQDDCVDSGFSSLENNCKPIFLKVLKKIWENKGGTLPWPTGKYSSSNTLLIEDEPSKALLNPPNTAVFPDEYKVNNGEDTFLGPKGDFRGFLDGLAEADEVSSYVEKHRFGQPAITKEHPDWSYYEKILQKFSRMN